MTLQVREKREPVLGDGEFRVERRLQVINGPDGPEIRLPLFPRKRTQVGHRDMSVSCQEETFVTKVETRAV